MSIKLKKDFYCGLYDIIFRSMFLKNKDMTAFVCNELIPEENIKPEDIEYVNGSILDGINFKTITTDVRFQIISNNLYGDIEMQKNPIENFTYRIDLYTSKIMTEISDPDNDYKVKKVIVISFCDFKVLNNQKAITIIQPVDIEDINGYKYYWRKNIYIQLPYMEKCDKIKLAKFIEILKSDEPDSLRGADPFMNKVIDEIKMLNQDENTRAIIDILEKKQKDENTRLNTAINKAKAEGIAEGKAEGIAEGKAEGKAEEKIEVAKKLKENNVSIDIIICSTGLSKEEIEKL